MDTQSGLVTLVNRKKLQAATCSGHVSPRADLMDGGICGHD